MKKFCLCLLLVLFCLPVAAQAAPYFDSIDDVREYVIDCTARMDESISFSFSRDLEGMMIYGDSTNTRYVLGALLYNCGVQNYSLSASRSDLSVTVKNIKYLPGVRMVYAWRTGDTSFLGGEERTVLGKAEAIVEGAKASTNSTLGLEMHLYDFLCQLVTYELRDEKSVNDTATGALQYGTAECDGYADAFYLLGNMAGFQVAYQYGTSASNPDGAHLWNIIRSGDYWYHVDATWDDLEYDDGVTLTSSRYLNCGADLFYGNHYWSDDVSYGPIAQYTDWSIYPYSCNAEGVGSYYESLDSAARYVAHCQDRGYDHARVMVGGLRTGKELNNALGDTSAHGRWTTWTWQVRDEYTCFDVLFFD